MNPSNPLIIQFRSNNDNFWKEEKNQKRNTVRFTDDWNTKRWDDYFKAKWVEIIHIDGTHEFRRKIKDKTEYKNVVIISW